MVHPVVTDPMLGGRDDGLLYTTAEYDDDGDSSSSSQGKQTALQSSTNRQKRKASEGGEDDEKEQKRKKNREAAKRCRDKKQQQTDDLRKKNSELQQENCQLAKEREKLKQKCIEYQHEIEQHRQQGCMVPHFNPPYNLDELLNPATPPSPSFSESAPSLSPCPSSPAPSVSPGPPPRQVPQTHHHPDLANSHSMCNTVGVANVGVCSGMGMSAVSQPGMNTAFAPIPTTVTTVDISDLNPAPRPPQIHYLRVRVKDGSHKTLRLDEENYQKVMQRMKALKEGARQAQHPPVQRTPPPPATVTSATQPQQLQFVPQFAPEPQIIAETNPVPVQPPSQQPQMEEPEQGQKAGQKLDTYDDLISVLKGYVQKPENEFELTPVDPNEVYIKQEPQDNEYEQTLLQMNVGSVVEIKQESASTAAGPSGQYISTGQQIRAGLDVLANPEEPVPSNHQIQNIVQMLEREAQSHERDARPVLSVADPAGAQIVPQPAAQQVSTARGQRVTYVTSSAPVGSLSKPATASNGRQQYLQIQQPNITSVSAMKNIKLRPNATQLMNPAQGMPAGKPQTTSRQAASARQQQAGQQMAQKMSMVHNGVTVAPKNMEQDIEFMGASWKSGNVQTSQSIPSQPAASSHSSTLRMTPGQQVNAGPPLQVLRQVQGMAGRRTGGTSTSVTVPVQDQVVASNNLMTFSTAQINEYLSNNSIETMDS